MKRVFIACGLGGFLEFYEFTVFGYLAKEIAQNFFEGGSILQVYGFFAIGFLARPVGSYFFGKLGDRKGRRISLTRSMMLMAFATFMIGVLPTKEMIGIWASVLLLICRLLQGISAGGEFNGALIYLAEHAPKNRTATYISALCSIVMSGVIFGGFVAYFVGKMDATWAWRVPFLLGSVLGGVALFIRRRMSETPEFVKNKDMPSSVTVFFKEYKKQLIYNTALASVTGWIVYFNTVWLFSYSPEMKSYSIWMNLLIISLKPLFGRIADIFGVRFYLTRVLILFGICSGPITYLFLTGISTFQALLAQIILSVMYLAGVHTQMYNTFPVKYRYLGTAMSYSLGMGIMGGLTPLISSSIMTFSNGKIFLSFVLPFLILIALILHIKEQKRLFKEKNKLKTI